MFPTGGGTPVVGTKAAAASVVATTSSAEPEPEPRTLVIDRPFLFFIVDDTTGAPVFAGIVEDPTAG